jgi:hypothetical protein
MDLPVWQALYEELGGEGFTPITVALDQSLDDARPWIEAAAPTHPALVDTEHVVADLFNVINVPTMVWIDEAGRIARPNDVQFGTDTFVQLTGRPSGPFLAAIRGWVRDGTGVLAPEEIHRHQVLPSREQQEARAEFTLAWHLHRAGRREAAERHFARAGELAPGDWTIRRGSLPIRGIDPMASEEFLALWQEGTPGYPSTPLPES